jgi:branched-chain amino acid transport system ATP-binding protein
VIVDLLLAAMHRIRRESGMALLLVEQHVDLALELTSRVLVLDRGVVVYDASDGAQPADRAKVASLVGVETMTST